MLNGAIPDLRAEGMNDAISSMRMRGEWTACTDANFRGQCQTFSGDVNSLRSSGMNDRISSLRPDAMMAVQAVPAADGGAPPSPSMATPSIAVSRRPSATRFRT